MRGFVEESDEVRAARNLRDAAELFVGLRLCCRFKDLPEAELHLYSVACAYAETMRPKRRRK